MMRTRLSSSGSSPRLLSYGAFFLMVLLLLASCSEKKLTQYVNPMVGTDAHGHTFPGAIVPFGQIQPSPDTRLSGWDGCSGYHFSDDTILGFSHTHLSGTGCEDYGDLLFMPIESLQEREKTFGPDMRQAYKRPFHHKNETAHAGYYKVMLEENAHPSTIVELTANRRVAFHRYTYLHERGNGLAVDLRHRGRLLGGSLRLTSDSLVVGYRRSSAWNPDRLLFFAFKANVPIKEFILSPDSTQAYILFEDTKQVELSVAISGVDVEGALGNLATSPHRDFETARRAADRTWEEALSKIRVHDGTKEQRRCFYTALYHCMTAPYLWSDEDGRYRGTDGLIHLADEGREVYTVFSLWDTYRALHPLLTEIEPRRTEDFVYTAMKQFEQGGELPMWELSAFETHCMIGYHAVPMILTAYLRLAHQDGTLAGYTPQELLAAMVSTSNRTAAQRQYARQGYLSSEVDNESVSKTLEYAYDDWCIARMAEIAADSATARLYWLRCQSWQNLTDSCGFARPRRNGAFLTPFDPTEVNNHYTEANSYQYSTYVPHDFSEWVSRIGGREQALRFLDTLFEGQNSLSGRQQDDITGLIGLYAHGNEPSHHAAFLYQLLGRPEQTEHYVHRILNELYTSAPDGLCGNEDCGQMSAWYVLASLGMYQICPGSGQWMLFDPLFHDVETPYFPSSVLDSRTDAFPLEVPDSLRQTPCPLFPSWSMHGEKDQTLHQTALSDDRLPSPEVTHVEVRTPTDRHATLLTPPSPQYSDCGALCLIDRIFAPLDFRLGGWLGWQTDAAAVVELDRLQNIHRVEVDCLQHVASWIVFPRKVKVYCSADGEQWSLFAESPLSPEPEPEEAHTFMRRCFKAEGHASTKWIKVEVENYGVLPPWHISAGRKAWIFIDEITII